MEYVPLRFKEKKKDWFSLVGALGYLLLPYHVYVVTESVDRSQILIWMVVPILAASLVKCRIRRKCSGRQATD